MKKETEKTINVPMEVMSVSDSMAVALVQGNNERIVNEIKKKENKTVYVDGPAQRLANIRISLRSAEKHWTEWGMKMKDLRAKEKKLVKLMQQMDEL